MAYNLPALEKYEEEDDLRFLGTSERPFWCKTCSYCNGERDPTPKGKYLPPFEFWEKIGMPKYTVAPMVEQSELPFRMLCRKYGATLAYTPMFHSRSFMESAEYRKREFSTCPEDRPVFVQFCGHDPDTVLAAARHVEKECDAVDVNLGCPQGIAKRGFYGSFLMERWDIIHTIIHTLKVELSVPVTAKMRVFDTEELTLKYARMIRDAGAHVIAVHGRTREMKGQQTGMADMHMIRKVRECVGATVPVIANGNILTFADCEPNMKISGCNGVMSAEALLWDPRLFSNPTHPVLTGRQFHCDKTRRLEAIQTAAEYLHFVREFPVDLGFVKAHLFKILYHSYEVHQEMRNELGDFDCHAGTLEELHSHVSKLREMEAASEIVNSLPRETKEEKKEKLDGYNSLDLDECCGDDGTIGINF